MKSRIYTVIYCLFGSGTAEVEVSSLVSPGKTLRNTMRNKVYFIFKKV